MFFELRQYQIRPGKREEWVQLMDEVIIPFQRFQGMTILGSFVDEETDRYIWIRRFEDEESRKALYAAVYESDFWKNEMSDRVGALIDRSQIQVTRMTATPQSAIC